MAPLLRRTWAPKGKRPVLHEHQGGPFREKVSVAGAFWMTPHEKKLGFYFKTLINEYFNNFYVAAFVEALIKSMNKPIILVWDRATIHKGDSIRELKRVFKKNLYFELPPYAPMLNPTELLWSLLKHGRLCNFAPQDIWELDKKVNEELEVARRNQDLLRGLLQGSILNFSVHYLSRTE